MDAAPNPISSRRAAAWTLGELRGGTEGVWISTDPFGDAGPRRRTPALIREVSTDPSTHGEPRTRIHWRRNRTGRDGRARRSVLFELEAGTDLYGLGEGAGPLRRNGRRMTLWNADHYAYDETTPSLYQSHPWVIGVRRDGSAFGVMWDTACRSRVQAGPGYVLVRAEDGGFPVIVIERESAGEVVESLARLTGVMELPPRWALGYHQSRYSYYPESEVRRIAGEMRTRRIPCDVIWFDIHYMEGNRSFTFDPERFPDPKGLLASLRRDRFRSVLMIDPGLKVDPAYHAYREGRERGVFVRTSVGQEYHGQVWPGACAFPDFSNAGVRHWWGELYREFLDMGVDGFWNDMNEPAIFDGPGRTMPLGNLHNADAELGGPTTHARMHNIYGMLMVRATREGIARHRPEVRPFVLTRSNFMGGQRYAATWTGDNSSTWAHLGWSITMALNLGLSGQPMSGPDIGGFEGNADGRLFARWMGVGAMLPFCRAHTDVWTVAHEPWSWGPGVEATCRRALVRRYRMLPYWYTLFHEASVSGLPPMRPLFFADPTDLSLRDADDAFLLGRDVMVRCATTPAEGCRASMPRGNWCRFDLVEVDDPELPELWIRGGAIVPIGPAMQHEGERSLDPLTLLIALDERGEATGTLYEDEGDGYGYREGRSLTSRYFAKQTGDSIRVWRDEPAQSHGGMQRPSRGVVVRVVTHDGEWSASGRDGEEIIVRV